MERFEQLVEALRHVGIYQDCNECEAGRWHNEFDCCLFKDAADAIEALRFELDCVNDSIKQLALPVDGEWVRVEDGESYHYECSECGERPLYSRFGDIVLSGVCPLCGAKMEVQDG